MFDGDLLPADGGALEPDRRRQFILSELRRIQADQSAQGWKPQPSVGCFGARRLKASRTFHVGQPVFPVVTDALDGLAPPVRAVVQILQSDIKNAAEGTDPENSPAIGDDL